MRISRSLFDDLPQRMPNLGWTPRTQHVHRYAQLRCGTQRTGIATIVRAERYHRVRLARAGDHADGQASVAYLAFQVCPMDTEGVEA